jgi:RNA polymerase sigma factor (sigma-70 family)
MKDEPMTDDTADHGGTGVLDAGASPYEAHRDYVLGVLGRRCGWLNADDREAVFHDAYAVMLEKEQDGALDPAAMHARQVRAYLTQTAINKALDEGKRAERNRTESLGERAFAEPDAARSPEEVAVASFDSARVREIIAELPKRRQAIVKLRFYFERTPEEIQNYLEISERTYRRELERALKYVAERYELVRAGRFCDSRRSLVLAYVSGIAAPSRARKAAIHLASCPACARWAQELRETARRAGAVAPLPAVGLGTSRLGRVAEVAAGTRDGLEQIAVAAKQHATALATRVDPSAAGYASASRPGTVAAAVAGCIAIGGGATYCAVEGVPGPIRPLVQHEAKPKRSFSREPKPRTKTTPATSASAPEQPAPTPVPTAADREPAPPPPPTPPTPPPLAPAGQEFGLEEPAPAPTGPPAPSGSPGGQAAAPQAPPGEFDP